MLRHALPLLWLVFIAACGRHADAPPRLVLATTHTLEDPGLLDTLVAGFRRAHPEQDLHVVVSGSGEALEFGRRGDADVLLTHSPEAEQTAARSGWILDLRPVMHNQFVLLGPAADPASVRTAPDAVSAFGRLRDARATFISRGDNSGTHRRELALWHAVGVVPDWPGYIEAGVGMADALRVASARVAYILSDRATWLTFQNELARQDEPALALLFEDPARLVNRYSVSQSYRARNREGARVFADWITSADAQRLIAGFGRDRFPEPLFTPEALADTLPHAAYRRAH